MEEINLSFIEENLTLTIESEPGRLTRSIQWANEPELKLYEGAVYHFEISSSKYQLRCDQSEVVKPFPKKRHLGRIEPNIFVGTLELFVVAEDGTEWSIEFEVQSKKTDYRSDYQQMLGFITEQAVDLLYDAAAPVSHRFTFNPDDDPKTAYQRFSFLKSLLDSSDFEDAVNRILAYPVTRWSETEERIPSARIKKHSRQTIRQLSRRSGLSAAVPEHHPLHSSLDSIPMFVYQTNKTDTVDTPENRFVKFVLTTLLDFVASILELREKSIKLDREARTVHDRIEAFLKHEFFKDIGMVRQIELNSPVLQRKEGYRELLAIWLQFDMAARLIWEAAEDEYRIGKKDVATLYEYWLFFQLLNLISELFDLQTKPVDELIESTNEGLELRLKQGNHIAIEGVYLSKVRPLHVKFSYNRTFNHDKNYQSAGSWSLSMRPDYTLSFWPEELSEREAEQQELITHVHLDAKYKVEGFSSLFKELEVQKENDFAEEKESEQKALRYKNADILKMHAYKDAIRRTGGSYVLYPGTAEKFSQRGFHEIIPGLGAFAIKPGAKASGLRELREFLVELLRHFENRISKREKVNARKYQVGLESNTIKSKSSMPEFTGPKRGMIPDEVSVLVGYMQSKQKDFIEQQGVYNIRIDDLSKIPALSRGISDAGYVLLWNTEMRESDLFFEVVSKSPRVLTKQQMLDLGYPNPSQEYYLVFDIQLAEEPQFEGVFWAVEKLKDFNKKHRPFAVSLIELMEVSLPRRGLP